ncbi:regulator of sigma E protease [Proteiniborus ethanoligenes]|uniref:Zinc metalloprotease n=1 Tax=Proteiniborus ethanoligenes TaxID=415015 RepID=A0A1H3N6M5_9FIRM|nr:RIP metalloprotease RseP [Proteiniborus ethanoligenes]SDY84330.1 regulator of sigma E protease [Proteiniborus ethanoligenes]
MQTALATIFVFFIVVLFHEFGHFIVAKLSGIKVHEFAIGMGPKLFKINKGETDYSLRLLPIGGYVKMEGEDEYSNDARSFSKKSIRIRMAVIAAGAIMNFVLAIIVFSIYSFYIGVPTTTIDNVTEGLPAYEAGLRKGDTIITIDNYKVNNWEDVKSAINASNGLEIRVTVLRNEKEQFFSIKPIIEKKDNRLIIGIYPEMERSLILSIKNGFENVILVLGLMFQFFVMLFKGKVSSGDISGPIGIVYLVGEAAKSGTLYVLYVAGFISINLGFFNLLPIPALDGSRLVFLLIELVRGKPVNPEKEGFVHFVGLVLLMALMLVVAYKDIIKFNVFRW